MSVWSPDSSRKLDVPKIAEKEAVKLLRGVGGTVEWWLHSPARIGHLRVALMAHEYEQVPPGCVVADAGESGPQRPRTY